MLISGIILYFKPEGSVARWLAWDVWGLSKSGWEAIHTVFSFLFLLFTVFHILKINLKYMRLYFVNYKPKGTFREMNLALVISLVFFIGTSFSLPPFQWIFDAGDYLSDTWSDKVEIKHEAIDAKQPMREVAFEMGIDNQELLSSLEEEGIDVSMAQSLRKNALNNGVTPYELYKMLLSGEKIREKSPQDKLLNDITLEEMATILGIRSSKLVSTAREFYGLEQMTEKTSIGDIARNINKKPGQVRKTLVDRVSHLFSFPYSE
jgi:hypothetical protein